MAIKKKAPPAAPLTSNDIAVHCQQMGCERLMPLPDQYTVVKGTPQQIVSRWTVNGQPITESMVSALCHIGEAAGFARIVEKVKKEGSLRGKPARVWEIKLPTEWQFMEKAL